MQLGDALEWLDRHQNLERMLADHRPTIPSLDRMRRLVDLLGHPEAASPALHVTGTNGKTSTAWAITRVLMAKGLQVGTYTSPHLERVNERMAVNGEAISDRDLAEVLSDLAGLEPMLPADDRLTWFEILTGAALRWFADKPVDVVVCEVGLGGRWDATNVVDGAVAAVTNIGWDHLEFLGPSQADIAREKAGIVKPGSTVVLGVTEPDLQAIFCDEPAAARWLVGRDFACTRDVLAVGGRSIDIRTPGANYAEVWLDLHGAHQARNFTLAVAATEAFFGAPIEEALVREAAATVTSPGRLEVVRRHPLVILDGAKNVTGAQAAIAAVDEEFGADRDRILVVGMLGGKDPADMLQGLEAGRAKLVVTCAPPSPRALPARDVADAAARLGATAVAADSVATALERAMAAAGPDDLILVAGSLYVVGAARAALNL
ncbi:MAG: bifunctional folylpolyglutamate synthase/dihydrofolate synthase [Acidimicrobiaceae bacterium]|nr:bifunctional folylpolyglutamate synthase/dihydrofolate synthase [Acidimicrobiaceae bacterium]